MYFQSLFEIRKRGVKKTVELWRQAFSGEVTIFLPEMRPFNIKQDLYSEGFNPFENHVLYKLDRRLYLIYQATKYRLANILGIFPEVYFVSDLTETIFFRIRHRGNSEYGYSGGFKNSAIRLWKDIKFGFEDYVDRRKSVINRIMEKLHVKCF